MPSRHDPRLAENLRRWTESGQPRRWVESRCGGWGQADWFVLLANLRHSEFWPMDPREIARLLGRFHREKRERDNVRRWVASGRPRQWVEARGGLWGRRDWLDLLEELRTSAFWPVQPDAAREALEWLRAEWQNLHLWEQSGRPRRWVEARGGVWSHKDWLALLDELRDSEFWPVDPAAVGRVLEAVKGEFTRSAPAAVAAAVFPCPALPQGGGEGGRGPGPGLAA
jgi:hypothetical protein